MASELASGNHDVRCRECGNWATIRSEGEHILRVECAEHGTQTLWGDELE